MLSSGLCGRGSCCLPLFETGRGNTHRQYRYLHADLAFPRFENPDGRSCCRRESVHPSGPEMLSREDFVALRPRRPIVAAGMSTSSRPRPPPALRQGACLMNGRLCRSYEMRPKENSAHATVWTLSGPSATSKASAAPRISLSAHRLQPAWA